MFLNKIILNQIKKLCSKADDEVEKENYDKSLELYEQAKNRLTKPIENWEATTWIFVAIGDCHYLKGNFNEALNYFNEALKLPNGIGNAFILFRLGQCYYELEDYNNSKKYLLQAYMIEGKDIFADEEEKYFALLKQDIKGVPDVVPKCNENENLQEDIAKTIEELRAESVTVYRKGDIPNAISLLEKAWDLLPGEKYIYKESFLIATFILRLAIESKDDNLLKEWRDIILVANPHRPDSGEREMWVGRASYHVNDYEKAKYYFSIADKKSQGRCFRDDDTVYKEFYDNK